MFICHCFSSIYNRTCHLVVYESYRSCARHFATSSMCLHSGSETMPERTTEEVLSINAIIFQILHHKKSGYSCCGTWHFLPSIL